MDRVVTGAGKTVRNVYFLLLVFVIIAMVSVVITIKSTRSLDDTLLENQKQILASAALNREILKTLVDCTDPKGECSKREAAGRAEAIGGLNAIAMAAAVCADRPGSITVTELRACVENVVKENP